MFYGLCIHMTHMVSLVYSSELKSILIFHHYLQVNVTADHRVIYGADLAQFLQTLASIIEDPKDLTF